MTSWLWRMRTFRDPSYSARLAANAGHVRLRSRWDWFQLCPPSSFGRNGGIVLVLAGGGSLGLFTTKKVERPWLDYSSRPVAQLAGGNRLFHLGTIFPRCSLSTVGEPEIRNFSASSASQLRFAWRPISSGPGDTSRPIVTSLIMTLGKGIGIGWLPGNESGGHLFDLHSCMHQSRRIGYVVQNQATHPDHPRVRSPRSPSGQAVFAVFGSHGGSPTAKVHSPGRVKSSVAGLRACSGQCDVLAPLGARLSSNSATLVAPLPLMWQQRDCVRPTQLVITPTQPWTWGTCESSSPFFDESTRDDFGASMSVLSARCGLGNRAGLQLNFSCYSSSPLRGESDAISSLQLRSGPTFVEGDHLLQVCGDTDLNARTSIIAVTGFPRSGQLLCGPQWETSASWLGAALVTLCMCLFVVQCECPQARCSGKGTWRPHMRFLILVGSCSFSASMPLKQPGSQATPRSTS